MISELNSAFASFLPEHVLFHWRWIVPTAQYLAPGEYNVIVTNRNDVQNYKAESSEVRTNTAALL